MTNANSRLEKSKGMKCAQMLTVAKWSNQLSKQIILADEKKFKVIKTDREKSSKTEKINRINSGTVGRKS